MSMFSVIQVNRIYLIFNLVHFLVDSSVRRYTISIFYAEDLINNADSGQKSYYYFLIYGLTIEIGRAVRVYLRDAHSGNINIRMSQ